MYKINAGQKNAIEQQPFARNKFYNPVQDINGDWFISEIEMNTIVKNKGWKNSLEAIYVTPETTI